MSTPYGQYIHNAKFRVPSFQDRVKTAIIRLFLKILFLKTNIIDSVSIFRSSRAEVFCKKGVVRNSAKLTGKQLRQSLFFNKVAGLRPATSLKKTLTQVFSCEFCKIYKNTIFKEHIRWLLLNTLTYLAFFLQKTLENPT